MAADDTPTKAPFDSQEGLNKFVADAREVMTQAKTDHERLQKTEQLASQLQAGMDELQKKQADAARYHASGREGDVVRAYTLPAANRDDIEGGIVDLTKGAQGGQITEGRRWLGSTGGVIRMLGGMEDGYWEPGLLDDNRPRNEWQQELQDKASMLAMVRTIAKFNGNPNSALVRSLTRGLVKHLKRGPEAIARMFSGNAGEGGEWVQTLPLTMIERTAELPRIVEGQIEDLPLSAGTVKLPFLTASAQAFVHGKPIAGDLNAAMLPKSVPSTTERTLTAPTLAVNIPIELDALEDMTVTDGLGLLMQLVGETLIEAREDCHINGDIASPHGDTALATWTAGGRWSITGSPADHRTAYTGWRQRAFDVSSASDGSANQDIAHYISAKSAFTTPHGVLDTFYLTSPEHYIAKIIVDTNVLTVDKAGPNASIQTGTVALIGGSPLYLSQFVTADMNASGLYDGSVTTYTSLLIVGRRRFRNARRRALRVNVEIVYRDGVAYLVASERAGMVTIDGSTVKNVVNLFKMAKS